MMAVRVILPFMVNPVLFKNLASSHSATSASFCGNSSTNFSRAFRIATGSRSSIVASAIMPADQSSSVKHSDKMASNLDGFISTKESSMRCQALLWAYTGQRGWCFGIQITQTVNCVSSVVNSKICSPSVGRLVQFSVSLNVAFWRV